MAIRLATLIGAVLFALPLRAEISVQEVTSPGGITAWLVEDHEIPFTALEIAFQGGTGLDLPGERGAVNLMAATLEEGSGDMDAQAFAEARDGLAAGISFGANQDAVSISARFLTENRDRAVELLRQAITSPRFDQSAVDRVRGQVLSNLASDATDPSAIAGDTLNALAFGKHPYGSDDSGTPESVAALTRDDLIEAKARTMARDRLHVAAVGDITPDELGKLLDRLFGDLPDTGAPLPGRATWQAPGGVKVVDFASPQSIVVFGQSGIRRDDPDFFAAYLMNEILGGSRFSARLMTEVREKRGLTYGIGTYLLPMAYGESLIGQMATANANVGPSIDLIRAEWSRMAKDGVSAEELAATKTYLTGSYPLRFDGNSQIAEILVGMQMDGLSPDYIKTRNAKIEAVTQDDIKRVAARLLTPDGLQFVVVGRPDGLK
ncbi:insulinase family protein [Tabrizicola sp. J26]|uniref:M16 family metallopeptidase n=1 Tax=Alitabrizicola rongguiensis TaxID=2909234 RepID=UPI001F343371|nr:pitrilysin family protein [Tabrizicola rongguiensis]MCF1707849.1 insulinase family protein [Tabrizicola rongguiensis]